MANSDKYKVEITGNNLQQYDSTVFRIEISAAEMSKTQVLQKQNLLRDSQMNKVFFNDYRALPFTSRREVILSVLCEYRFTMQFHAFQQCTNKSAHFIQS